MRIGVIGAGIAGALIARELCRYEAEVLLFERAPDVGWGVTKANSAIVHAGFHDEPGTLRAKFCYPGNVLYDELSRELSVPLKRIGAYVLSFSDEEEKVLETLLSRGRENGVPNLEIHGRDEILAREPHVNPDVVAGLWSPDVGITEPWGMAIAAVENALDNGLELHLSEEVVGITVRDGRVRALTTTRGEYPLDAVVNAAGLYADRIAQLAGLDEPRLFPRRGEYVLLDGAGELVNSVLYPTPSPVSKGILVIPTVEGGLLIGPNAENLPPEEKEATETTTRGLAQVIRGARRMLAHLPLDRAVKTFAGLRPESPGEDFVLGPTRVTGFYQAAALRSPGLTSAPAIARWLAREVIAEELDLREKSDFDPIRRPIPRPADMPPEEWDELIRSDPRWGRIVCFCNRVTEGEIVEAIRRGARTLDGVKFRTRAGFGRCQGGFCTDRVLSILARELGKAPEEIELRGPGSRLVVGRVRP